MASATQLLAATTPVNAAPLRARAIAALARGETPAEPDWRYAPLPDVSALRREIDRARAALETAPFADLHASRFDEIELELELLAAVPNRALVLPLAARRHGTPASRLGNGCTVRSHTRAWASDGLEKGSVRSPRVSARISSRRCIPVSAKYSPAIPSSVAIQVLGAAARAAGLEIELRIQPALAALAATGNRVLFLSAREYTPEQILRLVAHEILGHLTSAFNGRTQPLRLLEHGTAGSFEDQEGLCLWLERQSGTFDAVRRRTLALRIEAAALLYAGASFGEACMALHRAHVPDPEETVRAVERNYRAGGATARDVGYILGLDRVERLVALSGLEALQGLRSGRVSVTLVGRLPELLDRGLARPPALEPSTERVLDCTRAALRELSG